jgi:hypothetical protein
VEPTAGIEPATPSLPWKCSTPELHWLGKAAKKLSGRRDSNPAAVKILRFCFAARILAIRRDPRPYCFVKALNISKLSGRRDSNPAAVKILRFCFAARILAIRRDPRPYCFVKALNISKLSGRRDSNPRPSAWKADALPTELLPLIYYCHKYKKQKRYNEHRSLLFC